MVGRAASKTKYAEESGSGSEAEEEVRRSTSKQKISKPKPKTVYKDDIEDDDEDFSEPEDDGNDSDFGAPSKKKATPAKKRKKSPTKKPAKKATKAKKPAKATKAASRASGRSPAKKVKYADSDDEEDDVEESEPEEGNSSEEENYEVQRIMDVKFSKKSGNRKFLIRWKGHGADDDTWEPEENLDCSELIEKFLKKHYPNEVVQKKAKAGRPAQPKHKHPSISEMIPFAIRTLKDPPRKGSSLSSIKRFIADRWGLNVASYAPKIKKYLVSAVADGEIKQTRGKGASGRFTLPGMKPKKRPKKLGKKWDEDDEPEYQPKKSAREEEKEQAEKELELAREKRMEELARKLEEKENQPKKPQKPRKTDYVVEAIKGVKTLKRDDKTFYLVKWEDFEKPNWEPEENLDGCQDLIDAFLDEEEDRKAQEEERRRKEEEDGSYEVHRILEVKFIKKTGKREFLIRWKGHGEEDDTWEPEENLDCSELIERFMKKHEAILNISEKRLREAPKKVERIAFANSHRVGKRNQGFRVTYEDMDE